MVRCYEGNLGMGKTMNMVYDLMEAMKRGRTVIANTPIHFCTSNRPFTPLHTLEKICIYNKKYRHLKAKFVETPKQFIEAFMKAHNEIIAVDEAGIVFNRKFGKIPPQMLVKVVQSRKMSVDFFYTAQAFTMVDGLFKIITNQVYQCRKYNQFLIPKLPEFHLFGKEKLTWRDGRVFTARCVDPIFIIKRLSASKRGSGRYYIKYTRKLYPHKYRPAMNAYDTMYMVNMMPVGYKEEKHAAEEKPIEKRQEITLNNNEVALKPILFKREEEVSLPN